MRSHLRRNLAAYGLGGSAALIAAVGGLIILAGSDVNGDPEADYRREICNNAAHLPPRIMQYKSKGGGEEGDRQQAEGEYQDRVRSYCMAADALVIADRTLWVNTWGALFTLFSLAFAIVGLIIVVATNRETIDRWGKGE